MKPLALLTALAVTASAATPPPPGVVIHHTPASSGTYIGSPSICILPNGDYLASHDLFGPESNEHVRATGRLYRSSDKGVTWKHERDFDGFFWTNLFVHRGNVHTLGTDKHHGQLVIRRSADDGKTWTGPVVVAEGQWHTAPMPVIEHDGRLWRGVEDAHSAEKWGDRYRARMISVPAGGDLLDPASWTISNALPRDTSWLDGRFAAWLEGNAVVTPEGGIVDILRVAVPDFPDKAAIVRISGDGRTATFDPGRDFIDFSGGSTKFEIRKDPAGPGYWALANIIPERHASGPPAAVRNTLALVHSGDLRTWETRCVLVYHPDVVHHGFQYPAWQFDGDDLIAAVRTAWDDESGGAHRAHDANFLTFHRWKSFRQLGRKDDAPMPEYVAVTHETGDLVINGSSLEIARLENGAKAFSNRDYTFVDVPAPLAGKSFTRLPGGDRPILDVIAGKNTNLVIATTTDQGPIDLAGWQRLPIEFGYNDGRRTRLTLFERPLAAGESLRLPRGNWTGAILILEAP